MVRILDIPWCYYGIVVAIAVVVGKTWRWEGGILIGYIFLILTETILIRKAFNGLHLEPELFWSWRAWKTQRDQIIANIVVFIPIGILAGHLWKWRGLLFGVGMSIVIELLQLITLRGLCELDDILHNTVGTLIGVLILKLVR